MKKVLSVVLALAMVLALAVPAFATATPAPTTITDTAKANTGASTDMKGETKLPTIDIVVPKTASIVVNPYKLSVTTPDGATQDTVIAPTSYITNKSDIKMVVAMTVTGKPGSGVTYVTAAPAATETANAVFLKFEAAVVDDNTTEPDWGNESEETSVVVDKVAKKLDGEGTNPKGLDLAPATVTGETVTPNYIAYHVTGEAASDPAKPWTTAMTASVTVAFTFKPVANDVTVTPPATPTVPDDVTLELDKTTETNKGASDTDTLTVTLGGANAGGVAIQSVTWESSDTNEVAVVANDSDDKQGDVTIPAGATTGNSATVTAHVTLDNGATQDLTCDYTIA